MSAKSILESMRKGGFLELSRRPTARGTADRRDGPFQAVRGEPERAAIALAKRQIDAPKS